MLKQDAYLKTRGLINLSGPFLSSPGILKHPQTLIVPQPLTENVNADKVTNDPENLNLPVKSEQDVLAEAKPTEEQAQEFKEQKLDSLNITKAELYKKRKRKKNPDTLFFDL